MADLIKGFILGSLFGSVVTATTLVIMSLRYVKQKTKKDKQRTQEFAKEIDKVRETIRKASAVQDRMNKVKDLTRDQMDMQIQTELPQKNSLDGKYKNSLSRRIREIEDEKKAILQSILDDGFDPEITAMNSNSELETMKLSEFMGKNMPSSDSPTKTERPKLRLIKPESEEDN